MSDADQQETLCPTCVKQAIADVVEDFSPKYGKDNFIILRTFKESRHIGLSRLALDDYLTYLWQPKAL